MAHFEEIVSHLNTFGVAVDAHDYGQVLSINAFHHDTASHYINTVSQNVRSTAKFSGLFAMVVHASALLLAGFLFFDMNYSLADVKFSDPEAGDFLAVTLVVFLVLTALTVVTPVVTFFVAFTTLCPTPEKDIPRGIEPTMLCCFKKPHRDSEGYPFITCFGHALLRIHLLIVVLTTSASTLLLLLCISSTASVPLGALKLSDLYRVAATAALVMLNCMGLSFPCNLLRALNRFMSVLLAMGTWRDLEGLTRDVCATYKAVKAMAMPASPGGTVTVGVPYPATLSPIRNGTRALRRNGTATSSSALNESRVQL